MRFWCYFGSQNLSKSRLGNVFSRLGGVLERLRGVLGGLGGFSRRRKIPQTLSEAPKRHRKSPGTLGRPRGEAPGERGPPPGTLGTRGTPRNPLGNSPPPTSLARFSSVLLCAHATLRRTSHQLSLISTQALTIHQVAQKPRRLQYVMVNTNIKNKGMLTRRQGGEFPLYNLNDF